MSRIKNVHDETLSLHKGNKGMIAVRVKIPVRDLDDLTLAYSPGVAEPCLEINKNPEMLGVYTNQGNSVCVVSNGTAVLGLGDIGPQAALPVAEGMSLLFKRFADIDAVPLCVNTKDSGEIIELIEMLRPTYAGVVLEDIRSPQCFEIERGLKKRGIFRGPIFHDDQHAAAVVTLAALVNALKVVGKRLDQIRVVISGAGASGIATARLLLKAGVEHIVLCDSRGSLYQGRLKGMNKYKEQIAEVTNLDKFRGGLADALRGADVFLGYSVPNILTEGMIRDMADKPIVFALANPVPEIWPIQRAIDAGAAVVASGRGDIQNHLIDLLVFPGMLRGALDVRATDVNDAMKIAASYALADLVPPDELCAEKIVPAFTNPDVAPAVAEATARAAMDTGIARIRVDPADVAANLRERLAKAACAC